MVFSPFTICIFTLFSLTLLRLEQKVKVKRQAKAGMFHTEPNLIPPSFVQVKPETAFILIKEGLTGSRRKFLRKSIATNSSAVCLTEDKRRRAHPAVRL